jgi:putative exporter of polyketide antibiotics
VSIFAKTLRDSRRVFVVQLVMLGALPLLVLSALVKAYPTAEARQELVRMARSVGTAGQGLSGPPVNVDTIGGYLQWKYGALFVLLVAFWSILTLTRTIAGEAAAGSLDLLASTPVGRRRIAGQKVGAHVALVAVVSAVAALATWLGGSASSAFPGDRIPPGAAIGFGLWIGLLALAFGAFGFALSQLVGRPAGAWVAGTLLVAGPLLNNYRTLVRGLGPLADLTPWAWTADHLPLAGRSDWPSLIPVAVVGLLLAGAGVELFARRDLDSAVRVRLPRAATPVTGLLISAGTGIGAALAGSDVGTPMLGAVSLGLVAAGMAGIGLAVAGLVRARAAGPVVGTVVVLTYPIDLLVPALHLSDGTRQLAITAHLGEPMVGGWDGTGVALCLLLAVGGLALGGYGLSRRDLAG